MSLNYRKCELISEDSVKLIHFKNIKKGDKVRLSSILDDSIDEFVAENDAKITKDFRGLPNWMVEVRERTLEKIS